MADRKTVQLTVEELIALRRFTQYGDKLVLKRDGMEIVLLPPKGVPGDVSLRAGATRAERIAAHSMTTAKIADAPGVGGPW